MFLGSRELPMRKARQPYRYLSVDCLDNLGSSTPHNRICFLALLQEYFYTISLKN
jgi:hypothetical protein